MKLNRTALVFIYKIALLACCMLASWIAVQWFFTVFRYVAIGEPEFGSSYLLSESLRSGLLVLLCIFGALLVLINVKKTARATNQDGYDRPN